MSNTGRFWIKDLKTGRIFCIEPLENRQEKRIELQASETVVEDNKKHKGTIKPEESIIEERFGFKNIMETPNPLDAIEQILRGNGNDV